MSPIRSTFKHTVMYVFAGFCGVLLVLLVFLNQKMNADANELLRESHELLRESIQSQLLAICHAASELLDPDAVGAWEPDAALYDDPDYARTLERLRSLVENTGTEYIYVLKRIENRYRFVLDTDTEADISTAVAYDLSPVHEDAFRGILGAGIMNVQDEWGNFHTGAVPIWRDGEVIAIVSADIRDTLVRRKDELVQKEMETATFNSRLMAAAVAMVMLGMGTILFRLMRQLKAMQDRLTTMAHCDIVTGLPNRQYLIDYLETLAATGDKTPYALFFTDLDNFKVVNDKAGHDAGDALLKRVGAYLLVAPALAGKGNTRIFRPAAGRLNVTARIGGDEFVLLVPNVETREEAGRVAQALLDHFRQNVNDEHIHKYNVSLSIGAALYPGQSEDYHVILKYADIAMYHAKHGGKNDYRVYDHEMPEKREK